MKDNVVSNLMEADCFRYNAVARTWLNMGQILRLETFGFSLRMTKWDVCRSTGVNHRYSLKNLRLRLWNLEGSATGVNMS